MDKIEFVRKPEIDTIVGKPLEIGARILYPVIQISILRNNKMDIIGAWIVPIAIVVKENNEKYIIHLNDMKDEDIDLVDLKL